MLSFIVGQSLEMHKKKELMTPRLANSKKWTEIPSELAQQMVTVLSEHFKAAAKAGRFIVEGRIYPEELLLLVGHLEKGRLKQSNIEVSIGYQSARENLLALIHLGFDCAGSHLEALLGEEVQDLPKLWQEEIFEKKKMYFQFTSTNSALESEADKLLGEVDKSLVGGDDSDIELQSKISILGLDRDDDVPGGGGESEQESDDDKPDDEEAEQDSDDDSKKH